MKTQKDYIEELDELKIRHGWNDRELAAELGVTPAMLSNWRTGKVAMTAKTTNKVFDFIAANAIGTFERNDPATAELLAIWENLTVAQKHLVIAYAARFLDDQFRAQMPANTNAG